jgi:hypothetical protein
MPPSPDFQYDVFLSYHTSDKPHVRRLAEQLHTAGLRVWFDEWVILPGDDIYLSVERGLEASRTMVLCLSSAALDSEWVSLERSTVLFRQPCNASRRFIPLLLADCKLPDTLRRYRHVDFRQQTPAALNELLSACHGGEKRAMPQTDDSRIVDRPINLGFDGAVERGFPHGWFDSQGHVAGASTDYDIRVVTRKGASSGRCLSLRKESAERGEFASVMQRFRASHLAGRVVRLEGELKTDDVRGWAGLWMRADGDDEPNLFFDNMSGHSLKGTTDWSRHAVEGKLPSLTTWLNIGIVFSGSGTVSADNLSLRVWSPSGTWEDV